MRQSQNSGSHAVGQSLVEFALVLPVVMLIFMGIVQFGYTLSGQIGLINAVREAARYGSVSPTNASSATTNGTAVRNYLTSTLLPRNVAGYESGNLVVGQVCYTGYPDPSGGTYSVRMTVSVTYDHPLFVPLVGAIIDGLDGSPGHLRLGASEQFRVENVPLTQDSFGGSTVCAP